MLRLPQQRPSPPIAPPRGRPGLAGKRSSPPPGSGAWWHGTSGHGARLALSRRRRPHWRGLPVRCASSAGLSVNVSKCTTLRPFTVLSAYLQRIPCSSGGLPCLLLPYHSCPLTCPCFHVIHLKYHSSHTFSDSYLHLKSHS